MLISANMPTHYETLGIPESAKSEQIKRSYRRLVKRFHPDLFPAGSEAQAEAGERLSQLNAAYAILSKPYKKASYDSKLKKRRTSYSEPQPEYCDECGKPTLYWQAGRDARRCNECER